MSPAARRNYFALSGFLFLYFMAQGATISLLSIWYARALGLSGEQTGIVFAANSLVAMLSQPLYGFVSDKLGLRKHVLWTITALCIGCAPFFVYVYGPLFRVGVILAAAVGGVYLGITFIAGSYAVESYVDRVGRKYGFEYGRARMWGSLGFACAALFSGRLYNLDPAYNYVVASLGGALLVPVLLCARIDPTRTELEGAQTVRLGTALSILRMPQFWGFMVLILGVTDIYLVYDQQFPRYFASLFADPRVGNTMFGYLSSAQIFLEAGMLFVAPAIVRRTGPKRGLLLAAAIMVVRIGGSGLATGPVMISCMKLLHSLELPILVVSVFKYIARHFDSRLASTVYLVGFSFGHSLGLTVLSPIAGAAYDVIGFPRTYLLLAAFAGCFLVWACFSLDGSPGALAEPEPARGARPTELQQSAFRSATAIRK